MKQISIILLVAGMGLFVSNAQAQDKKASSSNTEKAVKEEKTKETKTDRAIEKAADKTEEGVTKAVDATEKGVKVAVKETKRGIVKAAKAIEEAFDDQN